MPGAVITAEQRAWGDQFEKVLGGKSAPDAAVSTAPPRGARAEADTFSKGMKKMGFPEPVVPAVFGDALNAPTPRLLSKAEWGAVAKTPTPEDRARLLALKKPIASSLAAMTKLQPKARQWMLLYEKAEELKHEWQDHGESEDVTRKSNEIVAEMKKLGMPAEAGLNPNLLKNAVIDGFAAVSGEIKRCKATVAQCLPFLDAPANNFERGQVGTLLDELGTMDSEIARAGKTKENVTRKCKKLQELQRQLSEWNDRRAHENLPPSTEAVALTDLVQKVHLEVIKEIASHRDWELPIDDESTLSPQEKRDVQKLWADLRDGTGKIQFPEPLRAGEDEWAEFVDPQAVVAPGAPLAGAPPAMGAPPGAGVVAARAPAAGPPAIDAPAAGPPAIDARAAAAVAVVDPEVEYRHEMLAGFARLLGTQAGRNIVQKLNQSPHPVKFMITDPPACEADSDERKYTTGTGSTIKIPRNLKDSDSFLNTETGNVISTPVFLLLGHELSHAVHNSRGENQRQDVTSAVPDWDNYEEYLTIHKGEHSENDLRHQYGLTAERFGHIEIFPQKPIATAFAEAIKEIEGLPDDKRAEVDAALVSRNFNPGQMNDKIKLALFKDRAARGPLLPGWNPNHLTVAQIKEIVDIRLPYTLNRYGWKPFGMSVQGAGDSMLNVSTKKKHHPRSPLGCLFRKYGGEDAVAAIPPFNAASKQALKLGTATDWPSLLEALKDAAAFFDHFRGSPIKEVRDLLKSDHLKPKLQGFGTNWARFREDLSAQQEDAAVKIAAKSARLADAFGAHLAAMNPAPAAGPGVAGPPGAGPGVAGPGVAGPPGAGPGVAGPPAAARHGPARQAPPRPDAPPPAPAPVDAPAAAARRGPARQAPPRPNAPMPAPAPGAAVPVVPAPVDPGPPIPPSPASLVAALGTLNGARSFEALQAAQSGLENEVRLLLARADVTAAQRNRCDAILADLAAARQAVAELNQTVKETAAYVKMLSEPNVTSESLQPLEKMLASPFLSPEVKASAEQILADAQVVLGATGRSRRGAVERDRR